MTQLMNMQDVQAKISEQVKVSMFNLIPDEKVQELVESEINAYFEAGTANFFVKKESGYGSNQQSIEAKVSPFRLLVWEQLNKVLSDKLQEIFQSPEFIERCIIGDSDKAVIQDTAMARQEKIALSMASVVFQRAIEESLMTAVYDTTGKINHSVAKIMAQHGHR